MRKRRWFQIHLSTAMVLMFAASALLYVNLSYTEWDGKEIPQPDADGAIIIANAHCGWPFVIMEWVPDFSGNSLAWKPWREPSGYNSIIHPSHLAANLIIALLILIALAAFSEWRVRCAGENS